MNMLNTIIQKWVHTNMIKEITSVNNQYIKELLSLRDKQVRNNTNLFIVEGYHLVEEALKHHVLKVALCTDKEVLEKLNVDEKYLVSEQVIKKLSSTKTPQNIVGVVNSITNQDLESIISNNKLRLVILDNINDPGNLGTIIRTSAALGIDAVISSLETVDYYNDKVLRATQGAIFKIPLFKMNLNEVLPLLKDNNIIVYGTHLESSISIKEVEKKDKLAIVVGNEAKGVSKEVLDLCDKNVILPMDNDVESLNVSIAAALLMWELK